MALALCAFSHCAKASEEVFIRMSCIPASGFFRIDHLSVDTSAVHAFDVTPKRYKQIMQAWRKRGYYEVDRLTYDCALTGAHYRVTMRRDPYKQGGMCAMAPRINFTLLRNGLPVLKDVPYGNDCYGVYALSSMEISEAAGKPDARICFARYADTPHCEYMREDDQQVGTSNEPARSWHAPIDKSKFEELTERYREGDYAR